MHKIFINFFIFQTISNYAAHISKIIRTKSKMQRKNFVNISVEDVKNVVNH